MTIIIVWVFEKTDKCNSPIHFLVFYDQKVDVIAIILMRCTLGILHGTIRDKMADR